MRRSVAIVIGVCDGPALTRHSLPSLDHPEAAAVKIADHAHRLGYAEVKRFIGRDAKRADVEEAISVAADGPNQPDTVFIFFSGHGHQDGANGRCEDGTLDEHWCLYDELLVDHRLLQLTRRFASTTRLFIVADCCFAALGSGVAGMPLEMGMETASLALEDPPTVAQALWDREVEVGRAEAKKYGVPSCAPPQARWILIAASATQMAQANVFMTAFLKAWEESGTRSSFQTFYDRVAHYGGLPYRDYADATLLDEPAFDP